MTPRSILCLAPSRGRADRIIHGLRAAEFSSTEIGALFFDRTGQGDQDGARDLRPTDAAAQSAGPIRGGLAWLAGIGRLGVPGVGAFFAAGPIIAALGQARNGAPGVAIARGLVLLGFSPAEAAHCERRIKVDGCILISVTGDRNRLLLARAVFAEADALDIVTTGAATAFPPPVSAAR